MKPMPPGVYESIEAFEQLKDSWRRITRPLAVLLLEDDDNDAQIIAGAVPAKNIVMVTCRTVYDAIHLMKSTEFDLCIIDLKLETGSGLELVPWLRAAKKSVPFVVLTGLDQSSPQIKQALTEGAQGVFSKSNLKEAINLIFGGIK